MSAIVEVENLSKNFKEINAVDELSFSVTKGEVYGFLGQNGAGKSTTIRMLLTLVKPSSGRIRTFGKDLYDYRAYILKNIGAIIEKPDLYKYLTAIKNLQIFAQLSGINPTRKQLEAALDKVGLLERAAGKVKTFSQGMKQRLGIACALIHDPQLIILDEPTNGLDPQGIADVRNLILQLSHNEGKTIFVSSHLLSEIEMIADSMLIIDKGRRVAEGKASELLHPQKVLVELETTNDEKTIEIIIQSQWMDKLQHNEKTLLFNMERNLIPELNKFLVENGIEVQAIKPKHSLEDFFLSLTTANQHVAAYKN